jgi:dihydrofolate reductase
MRKVTYGAACSLDGFIAAGDGAVDWLHFSPDARKVMDEHWAGIDALLMGRKTFEAAAARGGGGGSLPGVEVYLFSRTLARSPHPDVRLVSDDAGGFVRALKKKPGKGISVMGGSDLAASLFAAGVIDEVGLNIHPVVLGSGTPLFRDPGRRVRLTLLESRPIAGGCVLANYRVKR